MPHSVICRSAACKTSSCARHDFLLHLFAAAEQIEAGPGEQAGDRIEIGAEGLAADAGGLEGNGTAAAEAITHAGRVAEGALAELLDEFRQAVGCGAEVGVDFRPSRGRGAGDVLRALAVFDAIRVRQGIEGGAVGNGRRRWSSRACCSASVRDSQIWAQNFFFLLISDALFESTGTKVFLLYFRRGSFAPCGNRDFALAALPRTVVVHGEDLQKDLPVLFRVVRGGHQHAEDGSADEDERLAPPPFSKAGERLACSPCAPCMTQRRGGQWETGFR